LFPLKAREKKKNLFVRRGGGPYSAKKYPSRPEKKTNNQRKREIESVHACQEERIDTKKLVGL